MDADVVNLSDPGIPQWTTDFFQLFSVFPPTNAPTLRVAQINGQPVLNDPRASILTADVVIENPNPVIINIEATNIPVGTTVEVTLVRPLGGRLVVPSDGPLTGTFQSSSTTATVTFGPVKTEIQLRANWIP